MSLDGVFYIGLASLGHVEYDCLIFIGIENKLIVAFEVISLQRREIVIVLGNRTFEFNCLDNFLVTSNLHFNVKLRDSIGNV